MPTHSHPHAFLHFLSPTLLSLCFIFLLGAAAYSDSKKPTMPSNNGQYGTPNLPNATSNHIDWNRMNRSSVNTGGKSFAPTYRLFHAFQEYDPRHPSLEILRKLLTQLQYLQNISPSNQYQSLYAGAEVHGGNGSTDYTIPELIYSNELVGFDLGTDFLAGTGTHDHYSSFGLSGRYEVTNQGRALTQEIRKNTDEIVKIRQALLKLIVKIPIVNSLSALINQKQNHPDDPFDPVKLLDIQTFQQSINNLNSQPLVEKAQLSTEVNGNTVTIEQPSLSEQFKVIGGQVGDLETSLDDLGDHVVRQSDSPALSVFAGTHLISGSGSIISGGLSASKLFPFGNDNQPGVTLLYVAQGLRATLSPGYRHNAVQNGVAVIFQDRTPAKNKDYATQIEDTNPSKSYADLLRPPWSWKLGFEYTSPVFGLTKTYTGFVRYRNPKYLDITLAYGKDGLGKDYGSVSIGQSYPF